MGNKALGHLRVIECASYIAGPLCSRLLGDMGAEVIKIERPGGGDGSRQVGPFRNDKADLESSGMFLYLNNNKRSITLDISTPTGQEILRRLVRDADILVEDFGQAQMEKWGLSYPELEKINPGLVVTSITPFGSYGPYAAYKANELVVQALSGVMATTGKPDREPIEIGVPLSMVFGGLSGAAGSILATYHRQLTGEGQLVEIATLEALINSTNNSRVMMLEFGGMMYKRNGPGFPGAVQCKDGYVGLNALTHAHWEILATWLGVPDLLTNPIFTDLRARMEHANEIREMFREKVKDREKVELFHEGQALRAPTAPVATVEDTLQYEHLQERGFFIKVSHPVMGDVLQPGRPFVLEKTPWEVRSSAPLLGEANDMVYSERLGYSQKDILALRQQGII